jgi:HAMP domain-containing protein
MVSTLACIFVLVALAYFAYCCLWEIVGWVQNRLTVMRQTRHQHVATQTQHTAPT